MEGFSDLKFTRIKVQTTGTGILEYPAGTLTIQQGIQNLPLSSWTCIKWRIWLAWEICFFSSMKSVEVRKLSSKISSAYPSTIYLRMSLKDVKTNEAPDNLWKSKQNLVLSSSFYPLPKILEVLFSRQGRCVPTKLLKRSLSRRLHYNG